jgi:hypothetical protein
MFAFVVVLAWTAIPALACLPNATMTQAEMACCKKMAGDCHRSAAQHPCCKTKVEQPTSVAVVDRTATHVHPFIVATLLDVALLPEPGLNRVGPSMSRDLPPPAPPGLSSVLRI